MFDFDKERDVVVVTGASGFLGPHVFNELVKRGYKNINLWGGPRRGKSKRESVKLKYGDDVFIGSADLTKESYAKYTVYKPHWVRHNPLPVKAVINLAAAVGGIGANIDSSAQFMLKSLKIGVNIVEAVRLSPHKPKLVQIGTVCSYPKFARVPFEEKDIWNGYPEETNAPYGIAKKTIMELINTYNRQYADSFFGINLIPVNMYGPHDNFDPKTSHVIPGIMQKMNDAIARKKGFVELWGTGNASREFLYVEDCAEAIVSAMELYEGSSPVNIGTGQEITIKSLAEMIAQELGFDGEIRFLNNFPDGQPRRCLNVDRAKSFGFEAKTNLRDGLRQTIDWKRTYG